MSDLFAPPSPRDGDAPRTAPPSSSAPVAVSPPVPSPVASPVPSPVAMPGRAGPPGPALVAPLAPFTPPGPPPQVHVPGPLPSRGPSAVTVGVVAAVVGLALGVTGGTVLGRTVPGPAAEHAEAGGPTGADTPAGDPAEPGEPGDTPGPDGAGTLDEQATTDEPVTTDEGAAPSDSTTEPDEGPSRAPSAPGVVVDHADPADYPDGGGPTNPWPFGGTYWTDRWEVTVEPPHDATEAVLAHDASNTAPDAGDEYWVVPLAATYTGTLPSGTAWRQVKVAFVDGTGVVHTTPCGAVPDDLVAAPDVASGETARGVVCVAVPEGAEGLWKVTLGTSAPMYLEAGR
ncbi:hypothetical protein V5D56_10515 [Cellulosimicrobium sp. PMB13]|uniref:hypothetical protein n=1 Tax=Cellulosimicrobium sp. PMB13 TaxID=3120158 RepID=UPI003F4BAF79